MDEDNCWHEKEVEIVKVFIDYFDNVYSSSVLTNMKQVLQAVEGKVSTEVGMDPRFLFSGGKLIYIII